MFLAAVILAATLTDTFNVGETLDYDLTWLAINGGGMRLTIGVAPADPAHYRITSVAKTNPSFAMILSVRDAVMSVVNRSDFSTVRYEKHTVEHNKPKDDVTTIDEAHGSATRTRPNKTPQTVAVPRPVFDPLSLVYHLRALNLQPGTVQRFTVYADAKVYTLEADVLRTETIGTSAGSFQTVVVEPKMQGAGIFKDEGTMTIWFTNDARHIPVRIRSELKVGSITANLRAMSAGAADPEPPTGR
ncbi:MAG TPA: DUF3108 domain-containing protein [Thermoanaerobaculia bacterium]